MKVRLLTSSPTLFTPALRLILFLGGLALASARGFAAETDQPSSVTAAVVPAVATYKVTSYRVESRVPLATNILDGLLSRHTGPSVALNEIVQTAADVAMAYRQQGYATMNIIIAPKRIINGVVTLSVFPGAVEQIVVAGKAYQIDGKSQIVERKSQVANPESDIVNRKSPIVNTESAIVNRQSQIVNPMPDRPATPEELAKDKAELIRQMAEQTAKEKDTRVHVVSTNAGPRFEVKKYAVEGNSILPPETLGKILANIDGAYGTNVSLDGIRTAANELQSAYRVRGYVTVAVSLPPQKLTNGTVKIKVTEGRLADITVKGNHYFSSNNVMRSLPSLHQGMILNGQVFQAELNQANGNQDRQIYPVIDPGPDPGTSDLTLKVKDRIPLHGKVELNNQSSPGTPDLRLNSSAVYNNLWQLEHSLGVQYGFSPEVFKSVSPEVSQINKSEWNFYDRPLVANYSAFYRMPLGTPQPIEEVIANNPGSFGYNEANHKFNLPSASGGADITVFASRSTIDTGLSTLSSLNLYNTNGNSLFENTVQQDLTENNNLGFRLNQPLVATDKYHSGFSGGLDYKTYKLTSYKTNIFLLNNQEIDYIANFTNTVNAANNSPVPITISSLQYLPLSVRYDATLNEGTMGIVNMGFGMSGNAWHSGSSSNIQNISGSKHSTGYWVVLNPNLSWNFSIETNWLTSLRADGQWASEPLTSNEQFGAGGVGSVRGYREGQSFGDTGWHFTIEQQTPSHVVGPVYGNTPLVVRGSMFMDYARVYLLDPQGRTDYTTLWGAGCGGVASVGSHWEARFLLSLPLLKTATMSDLQPFFNFGITAQF